tara:strand:- start:1465 stop:1713 length:249 start_codon:yes stop_codon:yes gene_type:complete
MNNTLKNKYTYEGNDYITYEQAAKVLGIAVQSITGFATQNNVKRGQITLRGRKRGVLNTEEFYSVLRNKNYFGDQDQEVSWS